MEEETFPSISIKYCIIMKNIPLILLSLSILLCSCKRHCPAYPQEDTDYLPVDFVGQTLRYVFDSITIAFNVMSPTFSEKYDDRPQYGINDDCSADAKLNLEALDEKGWLHYWMTYYKGVHTLWIDFQYEKNSFPGIVYNVDDIYDEVGELDQLATETLPRWTSPTEQTYSDIVKIAYYNADTLYLSKQYGLLHWDAPSKHSLTLLP